MSDILNRPMPKVGDRAMDDMGITYVAKFAKNGCGGCDLLTAMCWMFDRPSCKGFGKAHDMIFVKESK